VHRDEENLFEAMAHADKDPRKSLHVDDVPVPSSRRARRWSR
jgi:crotonyl-CoA reductase